MVWIGPWEFRVGIKRLMRSQCDRRSVNLVQIDKGKIRRGEGENKKERMRKERGR